MLRRSRGSCARVRGERRGLAVRGLGDPTGPRIPFVVIRVCFCCMYCFCLCVLFVLFIVFVGQRIPIGESRGSALVNPRSSPERTRRAEPRAKEAEPSSTWARLVQALAFLWLSFPLSPGGSPEPFHSGVLAVRARSRWIDHRLLRPSLFFRLRGSPRLLTSRNSSENDLR